MTIFLAMVFTTIIFYNIPSIKYKNYTVSMYMILTFIVLFLLGSIRYNVGTDFPQYYSYFMNGSFNLEVFEPGYELLNKVVYRISNNPQSIIIVTTLIILTLTFLAIKNYSTNIAMSTFLFVFGFFYFDSLNVIRQYIAVMMIFFGFKYVYEKKYLFIFNVLLASLFHYSALFSLVMLFTKKIKIKKQHVISVYSIILIFNIFSEELMNLIFIIISNIPFLSKYVTYQEVFTSNLESMPYDFLVFSIILMLSCFVSEKTFQRYKYFNLYQNNILITVLLKGLALNYKFFDRISIYFSIYLILILPIIFKELRFKGSIHLRRIVELVFILYCLVRILSGQAGVINYEVFLRI